MMMIDTSYIHNLVKLSFILWITSDTTYTISSPPLDHEGLSSEDLFGLQLDLSSTPLSGLLPSLSPFFIWPSSDLGGQKLTIST